jgi:hypothetical protein
MLTSLSPRHLLRTALDLELRCARALQSSAPSDDTRLLWAEHANRLHAFNLFQHADRALGGYRRDLEGLLESMRPFDPYDRVWVTEGVGYLWGGPLPSPLPPRSLIPLHAGVGLSIARRLLQQRALRRSPDAAPILFDRCARAALPGYECVAIEAIGVAVRNLHPELAPVFDDALRVADPVRRACFWHGIGRGAYFATSSWQSAVAEPPAFEDARRSVPDDQAAVNATAGYAWAATLVNLPTPDVLGRHVEALANEGDAASFADGITSALIVWQDAAPDDDRVIALVNHDFDGSCGPAAARLVRSAAEDALRLYPALRAAGRLQDVFHCEAA